MRNMLLCGAVIGSVLTANVLPAVAQDAPAASQPAKKDPVAYAKLKEAIPDKFAGIKRESISGSKTAFGEMKLSQAEANYSEGDKTANITIIDYAAMPGMLDGLAAWAKMEIDNDSDTESTKTIKLNGFPALETFRKEAKEMETVVSVSSRFLVTLKVTGQSAEEARKAIAAFDLKKIEAAGK
ncbi:MAG: hypothetical protein QM754_20065 [Tepidisphaeraceae bacterium]